VPPPDVPPHSWLQAPWAQARLAAMAARLAPMELMLVDDPSELPPDSADPKLLKLYVESLTDQPQGVAVKLGGTWRLRLYAKEAFPAGEPLVKAGVAYTGPFALSAPYQPGDGGAAALAYQLPALEALMKSATNKGLAQAFH